jgi:hypothetical protein
MKIKKYSELLDEQTLNNKEWTQCNIFVKVGTICLTHIAYVTGFHFRQNAYDVCVFNKVRK